MPSAIGSFGLCPDGRVLVALRDGVYFYHLETGRLDLLCRPEPGKPENRLNDGKVGPDGRFWVGSMDDRPEKVAGAALYRIDPDGTSTQMLTGLITSNGLAWSPDGRTLWHSDSRLRFVQTFAYDLATGAISGQRRVRELDEAEGRPDGAACDVEGYYWAAGVSAGCLNRIAPDGTIERKVKLPVVAPTMPCFGGPDMKTLYVTSLTRDASDPGKTGTLIAFDVDVAGAPVARFGEKLAL
jgi:sugar lactone lactonase YvrE